ncbi:hypothetical protein [Ilumatobacter sp.]|uniref:hypothetical protein n=1 Tax=Ilumatobacter sp. TaxID=1967498 RepID=UPI003B51770F
MTDSSWNDDDAASTTPAGPPVGFDAPRPPSTSAASTTADDDGPDRTGPPADEATWVRSVYLFGACATGGVMMIGGILLAISSLVSVISPDAGLRDGWDRGFVGATAIAEEGVGLFEDFNRTNLEEEYELFCADSPEDAYCENLEEQIGSESAVPAEVIDSITIIRDEVHRQIRIASVARLVAGLAVALIGLLLFRFHSRQVTVYARS